MGERGLEKLQRERVVKVWRCLCVGEIGVMWGPASGYDDHVSVAAANGFVLFDFVAVAS
jgi:hypothetical protein